MSHPVLCVQGCGTDIASHARFKTRARFHVTRWGLFCSNACLDEWKAEHPGWESSPAGLAPDPELRAYIDGTVTAGLFRYVR